ncbi:head-tail connector protein [Pleomorphomonas oryzae]|uniref:head-tail connector protein n=1 Tax=Pleomorphomonas oryzae TaxID=261934 RepID=UPI000686BE46|nr:head-tail connector protein [Pleomorphomonas oryzae]
MIHAQRPQLEAGPTAVPVSLLEAKEHLRVDFEDDDTLITSMIAAVVGHLDGWSGILGRCLVNQSWSQSFDGFPDCRRLPLPFVGASSVMVSYYPYGSDVLQTLNASLWSISRDALGDAVMLNTNGTWPATADRIDAVKVTATYGYGPTVTTIPPAIKAAILLMIGDLYANRETMVTGTIATEIPMSTTVHALLMPHRRVAT